MMISGFAEVTETGKPVWSDLRQQKKTLPITAALTRADGHVADLRRLLAASRDDEDAAGRAAELIEKCGGREATERVATEHFRYALEALERADPAPEPHDELVALARFVVERDG